MYPNYDVIVVGGGHAGCEATHAAATMAQSLIGNHEHEYHSSNEL